MSENTLKRTCNKCKVAKPLACFYKDKARKDGVAYICKECDIKKTTAWKEKNKERKAINDKRLYLAQKEKYDAMTQANHYSIEPAVYMIKNMINGKTYIGTSSAPYRRAKQHLSYHEEGVKLCTTQEIADEVAFYGKKSFIWGVIEHTTKENKHECERKWIQYYQPEYNIRCK
jgi:hypothetical protein